MVDVSMHYKITIIEDLEPHNPQPEWDILPVAKLTQPSAATEQGIFAQAALCYQPGLGLMARLWAFEVGPARGETQKGEKSRLTLALAPNPAHPDDYLSVSFEPDGTLSAYTVINKNTLAIEDTKSLSFLAFAGGDLQGEYWGGTFILPQQLLTDGFGCTPYESGDCITGNMLHTGMVEQAQATMAFFPINGKELNNPKQFGTFEFIHF